MPIADDSPSDDDIFFEEQITIETKAATKTDAEIVEVSETVIEEDVTPRPKFKSPRGYWLAAIEYLQEGEEEDALWALEQALTLKPSSKISKILLSQIESDAINVLGEESFEYTIQYGDSLSKLAKTYLKDPLQFYILAKYNQISNPSRLIIGQTINIPGVQTSVETVEVAENTKIQVKPEVAIEETSAEVKLSSLDSLSSIEVEKLLQNEEFDALIDLLVENNEVKTTEEKSDKLLVQAYYLKAQKLLSNNKISEAKILLLKAADIEPDNVQINMALIDMDESDEAQMLVNQALKAHAANSPIEAYELINRALIIQPNFQEAIAKKEEMKKSLSLYYYKHALMAQRRHELNKAVRYWDEVLALDENNENAKLYRAKSISLQSKMKKFVSAS